MKSLRPLAFAILAAVVLCGCDRLSSSEDGRRFERRQPVVETLVLRTEPIRDTVVLLGTLEATYSVTLKPEISGVLEAIEFEEGTQVSKGDPLFRLRDDEQRARLHEARAEMALRRSVYDRTVTLAKRNAESDASLDRTRAEYEMAKARVELAKVELDRTVIRAPFDGVLGERMVSPGERVSSGGMRGFGSGGGEASGLARIDSLDQMELVFTIPETIMALVRDGVAVKLRVAPFPEELFEGEVYFVGPRVIENSRRVLVKARVPNPDRRLKPGMFAKLEALVDERAEAMMVPEDAVVYGQDGPYVWRVDDENRAERIPVELGIRQAGRVELRVGPAAGDRVVAAGTHKVSEGEQLKLGEDRLQAPVTPLQAERRDEEELPPVGGS